jgi:hypothetical protein
LTPHERLRRRCILDAIAFAMFGLSEDDVREVLRDCDLPAADIMSRTRLLNPKGFWRVDRTKPPECRQTVLSFVAYLGLTKIMKLYDGDLDKSVTLFTAANDGLGWCLPESLCLASYGLGRDARAQVAQPVAATFGSRLLDSQSAERASDAAAECELHAENLRWVFQHASTETAIEGGQKELF